MAASRVFKLLLALAGAFALLPAAAQAQASSAAPAAAPAAAPVQTSTTPPAYRINPGDELLIFVWGEERLQRSVRILPDGTFSFPLVGRVEAAGKVIADVEAILADRLKSQYRGDVPQVTVSVVSPSGLQFSIIGKVRSPGTFTPGRYVNVLEALSLAGGPAEFAQLSNIIVIRKEGEALTSFRVRLNDLLKGSPSQEDLSTRGIPEVRSGDTIIVP